MCNWSRAAEGGGGRGSTCSAKTHPRPVVPAISDGVDEYEQCWPIINVTTPEKE